MGPAVGCGRVSVRVKRGIQEIGLSHIFISATTDRCGADFCLLLFILVLLYSFAYLVATRMPRQVLCECCNELVTPATAKKHRDIAARMEWIETLGRAPIYTGHPTPPITAESVFGVASSLPSTSINDNIDIDNIILTPVEPSSSPPIPASNLHLPPHHPILEDDFQPDIDLDDLFPPEPYNEDIENSVLEEEFQAFSSIRYGWSHFLKLSYIEVLTIQNRGKHL